MSSSTLNIPSPANAFSAQADAPPDLGGLPSQQVLVGLSWALGLLVCGLCLAFPSVDGDAMVYAVIARNMVVRDDWVNLWYLGRDWLDKPHLPFWLMAMSFKLLGTSERATLVPGLLLYALGAWQTYRLAHLLHNERVAALAGLLSVSLFGLMLSAYDQRAEVYLLGMMPGATYALLRFELSGQWRWALLAALLGGCAMMTKGLIAAVLLGVGALAVHLHRWRSPRPYSRWRWLGLLGLGLVATSPELACLYLQFDLHPEKEVFDRTGVSGLRFFFWDSQFGRFLNTGPIKNTKGDPTFYLHNLLWTFFPWGLALLAALLGSARRLLRARSLKALTLPEALLWSIFLAAFTVFSATSYQMDYYLFLVFPYGVILCAAWLVVHAGQPPRLWLAAHGGLCLLALALTLGITIPALRRGEMGWTLALWLAALAAVAWGLLRRQPRLRQALTLGAGAALALFCFSAQFHHRLDQDYNTGRKVALQTLGMERHTTYAVQLDYFKAYEFNTDQPVLQLFQITPWARDLPRALQADKVFYVLAYADEAATLFNHLAAASGHAWRWHTEAASSLPSDGTVLVAQPLRDFTELALPRQFVAQLTRDDAKLQRHTVQLLKVTAQPQ